MDRFEAVEALFELGPKADAAVPALIELLADPDIPVVWLAADTLGKIGPKANTAAPALVKASNDHNVYRRVAARLALCRVEPKPEESMRLVTEAWLIAESEMRPQTPIEDAVRDQAGIRLSELLAEMYQGIADAYEGIGDTSPDRADSLVRTHLEVLVNGLKSEDARVRAKAAELIIKSGPNARAAVPALVEALSDSSDDVRAQAATTLGKIGPDAKGALPALRLLQYEESANVRAAASNAIKGISR